MGNFKFEKGEYLSEKDFEARKRYWNRKQFGTWDNKMLEKDSLKMQKLLVALSKFSLSEIQEIRRKKSSYGFKNDSFKMEVYSAYERDFKYAMSIAPKTFFKTECPNR